MESAKRKRRKAANTKSANATKGQMSKEKGGQREEEAKRQIGKGAQSKAGDCEKEFRQKLQC